ncbi:hypothetical protein QBC43DRAFT_311393 [Cladorrhinum sp. PSN259]|nr:hypothetical protein QBC43DRAFT_311393 [Cladorrhinum sp. PSN259]
MVFFLSFSFFRLSQSSWTNYQTDTSDELRGPERLRATGWRIRVWRVTSKEFLVVLVRPGRMCVSDMNDMF